MMGRPPLRCLRGSGSLLWTGAALALLLGRGAAGSLRAEPAGETKPLRIGFSAAMFAEVNENDAGAAVRVWAQVLGRDRGIPIEPAAHILHGAAEIEVALRHEEVDCLTMTAEEFWILRPYLRLDPLVVSATDGKITDEYLVLVRVDGGLDTLAALHGRSLQVLQSPRTSMASIWLDTLLAENGLERADRLCSRVVQVAKLARAVLPVFFGQVDACLVTRRGYESIRELNPQVGKQLKVLVSSPALVPAIFCFRANYESPYRERILTELDQLNLNPAGRQFMTLFQSGEFRRAEAACMDSTIELLERHRRLCPPSAESKP